MPLCLSLYNRRGRGHDPMHRVPINLPPGVLRASSAEVPGPLDVPPLHREEEGKKLRSRGKQTRNVRGLCQISPRTCVARDQKLATVRARKNARERKSAERWVIFVALGIVL